MPSSFKRFGEKLKQQLHINSGSTKVRVVSAAVSVVA